MKSATQATVLLTPSGSWEKLRLWPASFRRGCNLGSISTSKVTFASYMACSAASNRPRERVYSSPDAFRSLAMARLLYRLRSQDWISSFWGVDSNARQFLLESGSVLPRSGLAKWRSALDGE